MREIDEIGAEVVAGLGDRAMFSGVEKRIREFADAARTKCETLRTDPDIFEVWTSLVVSGERLVTFRPSLPHDATREEQREAVEGLALLRQGKELVLSVTRAR